MMVFSLYPSNKYFFLSGRYENIMPTRMTINYGHHLEFQKKKSGFRFKIRLPITCILILGLHSPRSWGYTVQGPRVTLGT